MHRFQDKLTIAAFAGLTAFAAHAAEPAFPTKPVRVLVGFSPGGGTDVAVRIIGKKLSELWGQQVVVDNRPGAGGLIAFDIVAKANPDGYTLLASSPSFAIQPGLTPKLPYDPIRDFAPITMASASPYVLVSNPAVEAKTVKELIALAKASPGKLNYASGGIGSAQHLVTELFRLMAGVNLVHVPYKGAVSVPDVIAGRVQLLMSGVPQSLAHIQAGRLRALGVTTPQRAPVLPNVPTIAEAGVPGYQVTVWYGIFATGRTPQPVLEKLNAGFVQAIRSTDVQQQLNAMGLAAVGNPAAEFTATVHKEIKQWADVIKRAGVKAE
ncbi:MAG TPA: tripartite tricarboxylate transporter substrate binding protein [Burkholderiales bacterium]|nr:tripartite tricarboxylate transporter substrate binding protein [Burkholderiales bacterium]